LFSGFDLDSFIAEPGSALNEVSALQAGAADQDYDFDQIDIVQVSVAAKYLTGTVAKWGEGDWNGSPVP
jgi:hypothetical protein